jgi:hypothetical protein
MYPTGTNRTPSGGASYSASATLQICPGRHITVSAVGRSPEEAQKNALYSVYDWHRWHVLYAGKRL